MRNERGKKRERRTYGVSLDGDDRVPVGEHFELVLPRLLVENLKARHRHHSDLESLRLKDLDRVDNDGYLRAGGGDGEVRAGGVVEYVAALVRLLDGGAVELGEVLTGETAPRQYEANRKVEGRTR